MTLDSPVSLLWAHQLRREHATIVAQIEELKALHPSALEHKRLVTRSEKAEATCNTLRQEVAELRTGHEKTVKVIEELTKDLQVKENTHRGNDAAREEKEEGLQLEVKTLSDALTRHQGELCSIADEVQNLQNQVEERNEATEQRLLQRENGMAELRRLIQVLDQKIEDAVTVIKDSIECTKPDEASTASPEDVSEADPFDLDANIQAVNSAPSGPVLSPSLAMIKEPTLPRFSQRIREKHPQPSIEESMQMLPDPSLPLPSERIKGKELPGRLLINPHNDLVQSRSTLSAYIQIADSQYQETRPAEEQFMKAFVQGLRDKRSRKKCEEKMKGGGTTWEKLKDCFPVASQHSQSLGKRSKLVRKRERKIVDVMETGEVRDGASELLASAKDKVGAQVAPTLPPPESAQGRQNKQLKQEALDDADERPRRPRPEAAAQTKNLVVRADCSAGKGQARTTKKRARDEQDVDRQAEDVRDGAPPPPPATKKRMTKKGKGDREMGRAARQPSIPILPSSDDEFSRGRPN